jgi:hypothetical protein
MRIFFFWRSKEEQRKTQLENKLGFRGELMESNHSLAGFSRFLLVFIPGPKKRKLLVGLFSFLVQKKRKLLVGLFSSLVQKKENYWLDCFHSWSKKKKTIGWTVFIPGPKKRKLLVGLFSSLVQKKENISENFFWRRKLENRLVFSAIQFNHFSRFLLVFIPGLKKLFF